MPPDPINLGAKGIDLSQRMVQTQTIGASPATAAETIIATLVIPSNLQLTSGVMLWGWAAFTVGTGGTAANLKIKQTNASGSTLAATGATTGGVTAASLNDMNLQCIDTAPATGGQYVLTLTVGGASATSVVSGCSLMALVV